MAFIQWNDYLYGIGVEEIDQHHKRLVELINQLHASLQDGRPNDQIGDVLAELVDYTKYHFSREEELMARAAYPSLARHRSLHDVFVRKITDVLLRLRRDEDVSVFELIAFLREWLLNHIANEDKKIGPFVSQLSDFSAKTRS